MLKGLGKTRISVVKRCVLANKSNRHRVVQVILAASQVNPGFPHLGAPANYFGRFVHSPKIEELDESVHKLLLLEEQRDVVCCRYVVHSNDLLSLHLAHVGDLLDGGLGKRLLAATGNLIEWGPLIHVRFFLEGRG